MYFLQKKEISEVGKQASETSKEASGANMASKEASGASEGASKASEGASKEASGASEGASKASEGASKASMEASKASMEASKVSEGIESRCPECNRRLRHQNLERHVRVHTRELPFVCNVCKGAFSHAFSLKRHMQSMHPDAPISLLGA